MAASPGGGQFAPTLSDSTREELSNSSSLTPFQRLGRQLADQRLLDNIPFHGVVWRDAKDLPGQVEIIVAYLKEFNKLGQPVTVWASWSATAIRNELPDVHLHSYTPSRARHQLADLVTRANFPPEFLPVIKDGDVLKAIIKCCLLANKASVLSPPKFSPGFLELVRKGCQLYKVKTTPQSSIQTLAPPARSMFPTPQPRIQRAASSTPVNRANTVGPNANGNQVNTPARNAQSSRKKRSSDGAGSVSSSGKKTKRLQGSFDAESVESSPRPRQPRQIRHATEPVSVSQDRALAPAPAQSSSRDPPPAVRAVSAAPPLFSHFSTSSQNRTALHKTQDSQVTSCVQPAPATPNAKSPPEHTVTQDTSKPQDELEQYISLHRKLHELSEEMKFINDNMDQTAIEREFKAVEDSRKKSLANLRLKHQDAKDALLAEHDRQLQELLKKHEGARTAQTNTENDEIKEVNDTHAAHHAKYTARNLALVEDKKVKLQEKNAVAEQINSMYDRLSPKQIRAMLDQSARQIIGKRKRVLSLEDG